MILSIIEVIIAISKETNEVFNTSHRKKIDNTYQVIHKGGSIWQRRKYFAVDSASILQEQGRFNVFLKPHLNFCSRRWLYSLRLRIFLSRDFLNFSNAFQKYIRIIRVTTVWTKFIPFINNIHCVHAGDSNLISVLSIFSSKGIINTEDFPLNKSFKF